jgi:hypothetical protein
MDEIQYASERDRAIQEVDRESILLRQVIAALLASVAHQMREIGLRTLQNRIAAPRTEAKATTSGA